MNVALVRKGSTEGPWALPEGWCWSLLSDVAFVNPATSFDHLAASDSITFVPMAAVAEETGTIDLSIERPMKEVAKGYVRFAEGDVIFAKITPCMENGKVACPDFAPWRSGGLYGVPRPAARGDRAALSLVLARWPRVPGTGA